MRFLHHLFILYPYCLQLRIDQLWIAIFIRRFFLLEAVVFTAIIQKIKGTELKKIIKRNIFYVNLSFICRFFAYKFSLFSNENSYLKKKLQIFF